MTGPLFRKRLVTKHDMKLYACVNMRALHVEKENNLLEPKRSKRVPKQMKGLNLKDLLKRQFLKQLTISLFLAISKPITLLKKLASRGFSVFSVSRKPYSFLTSSSLPDKASLICDTSEVSNSQAVLGYLKMNN